MATKAELEALVARQTECLRQQTAKIQELEGEIVRLNDAIAGNHDALAVLQKLYSDSQNSPAVILKACSEAIGFERSRQPVLSVNADLVGLAERMRQARLEFYASDAATQRVEPDEAA
jgi:hypothetical protein